MFYLSDIYSRTQKKFDPNTKVWVKTLDGEYTAINFELQKETDTKVFYFAHLSNEKQMTLGDLQAQIPQYRNDRKDVRFVFPDELNGFSVMAYDEKLALETFGKGEGYLVIATFDDLVKTIKKKRILHGQSYTVGLDYLKDFLFDRPELELNPIFQRGNVWTQEQQIAFVENFLRRPQAVNRKIYFNDGKIFNKLTPNENNSFIAKKWVCLDGLQRLTALLDFMDGKFACFDGQVTWDKIQKAPNKHEVLGDSDLEIYQLYMRTNQEVIDFYVDFNSAGTPHSEEEIERVKSLLS